MASSSHAGRRVAESAGFDRGLFGPGAPTGVYLMSTRKCSWSVRILHGTSLNPSRRGGRTSPLLVVSSRRRRGRVHGAAGGSGERRGVEHRFEVAAELVDVLGSLRVDRLLDVHSRVEREGVVDPVRT